MRYWVVLLLAWVQLVCVPLAGAEPVDVKVGGYSFPPFVDIAANGEPYGLTLDLVTALNSSQDHYRFRFVLTSPNRRFQDFAAGRFDMMLFEDIRWGWANQMMDATQPFLRDADLFVTRLSAGRDQHYFADLQGKQIFAVRGYHYAFADFEADPEILSARFRIALLDPKGSSLDRGLQQVASGQTELMIVTLSYLQYYFVQRPGMREQLLQASKYDTEYLHGALVRRQHALTAAGFDGLMAQLREQGQLQHLTNQYGVSALLVPNSK